MQIMTVLRVLSALAVILMMTSALQGCNTCGFDCFDEDEAITGTLSLGFSDAPLDDVTELVLTVDTVTLLGSGIDDVVVDTFTIADLGIADADTFSIDLLSYRGLNQLVVISDLELGTGSYSALVLGVLDGDINNSYAIDTTGQKVLNAGSQSRLSLDGITVNGGSQDYTVEFSLGQSLLYNTTADSYELTTQGVRVENNDDVAALTGTVDSSLFDLEEPCLSKTDPLAGNRVYLYAGTGLDSARLADVHTGASGTEAPADAIAPYATSTLVENKTFGRWEFAFGFLPDGAYTLVFSCEAEDDNPLDYDGFGIPSPGGQVYEITLKTGVNSNCDIAVGTTCS
jgi:hypothetical protein